jgi:hypothetical protein
MPLGGIAISGWLPEEMLRISFAQAPRGLKSTMPPSVIVL